MNHDFLSAQRVVPTTPLDQLVAAGGLKPQGGYGGWDRPTIAFFNLPAKTREARRHLMDREGLEKDRLRERRYGFQHYDEPGMMIKPDATDSAMYQADTDRFFTDVAAEERHRREERLAKKNSEYMRRREEAMQRDEERWRGMEEEAKKFDEKTAQLQASTTASLKNKTGAAFNPVRGDLEAGPRGEALRVAEQHTHAKTQARASVLDAHSRSAPYNPLTGAAVESGAFHASAYRRRAGAAGR